MQSVIQKRSCGSVKVFWLDKKLLRKKIKDSAKRMVRDNANIESVVLFGSQAEDRASVFSDADILIVVEASANRFIDRPVDFIGYFQDLGIGVDLFVYTKEEVRKGSSMLTTASLRGRCIAGKPLKH